MDEFMASFSEILDANPWICALLILIILWCIIYVPRIHYLEHKLEELEKENKELAKKVGSLEKTKNTD